MGSHYIPVGKIKIDKEILDIACPAAGYSETPPPPEIYCPAKGYYDPNEPLKYDPDPNLPAAEPGTGEIILICTTQLDAAINVRTNTSTGQANYSVYGANDTLISSQDINSGATFFYEFPASGGIELESGLEAFKVVITPVTGNLTQFTCVALSGWAPLGWPILECHVKCPDLTSFYRAFKDQKYTRLIKFYGEANLLTSLAEMASGTTNLLECHLPSSLNALSTMLSAFLNSGVENVNIQATSLPALTIATNVFRGSKIKLNPFSNIAQLPLLQKMDYGFYQCINLNTPLILPEMPVGKYFLGLAQYSSITKLIFQGVMNGNMTNANSITNIVSHCMNCIEVVMPTEMTNLYTFNYTWRNAPSLKKITLPDKVVLTNNESSYWFSGVGTSEVSNNIEEVTICGDWTTPAAFTFSLTFPKKLKIFNQPTLKVTRMGNVQGGENLEYFNVDLSGLDPQYVAYFKNHNFNAAELERISGQLPVVATGEVDFTGNPGYATFDKTIAEGKGWTVL